MILRLLHPGSASKGPLAEASKLYQKRIRNLRIDERFLKAEKLNDTSQRAIEIALEREGERILSAIGARDRLVVLDPKGSSWTSPDTAKHLQRWMSGGYQSICFALGSAYGLAPKVKKQAHETWSFGHLTLPHDLARVILWEQLYRAQSILQGEPYHK